MTLSHFNDEAFTGLEAAIVLIAFVVVASVFAYVTLGSGFMTTQKSQEVVHTGVVSASSTVQLAGEIYGISTNSETIDMVNFSVSLAPGGEPIDFDKVSITYSNETHLETLTPVAGLQSTSTTPGTWAITRIGGDVGSSNNLLEKGEQFSISVHPVKGTPKYTVLTVEIKPGSGSPISIRRTAPPAINVVNVLS